MSLRNISAWSIRNPVPPLVLFAALTIAGLVSFMQMRVQNDPDIDIPLVFVIVSQPGAAPTELENQITQRIEAAVRSITGIEELTSTVTEGSSQTQISLAIGTPIDRAVDDIRNAVQQIRGDLPDGILEPQVFRVNTSDNELASFTAVTTSMSLERLSWYVDNTVTQEMLSVPGLAGVERTGGVDREIRVMLDPARMQAYGITANQVNAQLRQTNLNAAGGRAEIAGSEQSLRVIGNAVDAYSLGESQISLGNGTTIKLSDIADVRDLYGEVRAFATRDGAQVLTFSITRARGESDLTVYDQAIERLRALEERNPDVRFIELTSDIEYTRGQYHSAMEALVEGAVLAVIVVFFFLRDWRATVISAVAIPLSAIPTFWFISMMGFTLNGMTLLALSLVAGVLVDDAIVEIENIVRHMRMGKTAFQASVEAADEIGLAVVATTFSIVAVFLPVGFMPGVAGEFFKNFGFTVVISVLISLGVARLITPMMAAYFLRSHGEESHGEGWMMDRYLALLAWTLKHRWSTVVAGAVALGATVALFTMLPQTFQPTVNFDRSVASVEMAPGSTLAQTAEVVRQTEAILERQPDVTSIFSRTRVGSGTVIAQLREDRSQTNIEFERSVAPLLAQIPNARVSFRSQFGGMRDVTITLGSSDPEELNRVANQLVQEMSTLPELVAPRVSGDLQRPEITIRPRFDLAADMGVTTAAISNAIRVATIGDIDQNSARFSLSDRQIPIRVAVREDARARLANFQNLPIPTSNGGSVPLGTIADIELGSGPTRIERINQIRRVNIGADLAPGVVSGDAYKAVRNLPIMQDLPVGVAEVVTGMNRWQAEMITNFFIALGAGILLVLAVLVLLYKRVLPPLVNMGSLLLAPLGGLIALLITGHPISLPVYIGILMLFGIVAKNSILLLDFALEEMDKGVDKYTAIMDAGHKRAQPILMTTVAMSAGMLPTALALSGDAAWRAPMGIVVMGGLILSTVLTLVLVPGTFSLALGIEQRLGPKFARWFTNGGESATVPQKRKPEPPVQPAE